MKIKTLSMALGVIGILFIAFLLIVISPNDVQPNQIEEQGLQEKNRNHQAANLIIERSDTESGFESKEIAAQTRYLLDWTMRDLEKVRFEESLSDPARFASLCRIHEMIYIQATKNFHTNDLPEMYSLLKQDKYNKEWRFIAQLIGFVSDRGNKASIDVLVDYLQREDFWPEVKHDRIKSFDTGMGKIMCLEWIGMVGGENAQQILLKALTPVGAVELAKKWIEHTDASFPGGRNDAIAYIRGRAAMGLVYCQNEKVDEVLSQIYKEEKAKCILNGGEVSEMYYQIVTAMATKDLVKKYGLQTRFELYGNDEYLEILAPYIEKYFVKQAD